MGKHATASSVVLFVNDDLWNGFDQLAAALRRAGVDPVRVVTQNARRGRYVRLVERLIYRGVLVLDVKADVRHLNELVDTGRVLDVQLNERMFHEIGVSSPLSELLVRATGVPAERRAIWIDKLALACAIAASGIRVPDQCCADELSPAAAVERLGLPLLLKRRTGTGGAEVRIVRSLAALLDALAELGGERCDLLYQQFIPGDLVGYGAVRTEAGTHQEFTGCETKGHTNPLGPTVSVRTTHDERVAVQGRRILEHLRCGPLAAVEFICDEDGTLWFIDLSTRAWGNFLSFIEAGLDFPAGYVRAIRGEVPSGPCRQPERDVTLRVVPASIEDDAQRPVGELLLALLRALLPYRRRLGLRYCTVVVVGVLVRRRASSRVRDATTEREPAPSR